MEFTGGLSSRDRGRRKKIINRRHILKKRRDRLTSATQFHIILLWSYHHLYAQEVEGISYLVVYDIN